MDRGQERPRAATLTSAQLTALSSPVRIAIFEALREAPASVAELAARLERTPHSLYHHLSELLRVRLVRRDVRRPPRRRPEAIYSVRHPKLRLSRRDTGRAYRVAATRVVRAAMRRALREHAAAQEAIARGDLPADDLGLLRVRVRLNARTSREVLRRIRELGDWIRAQETASGRPLSVLILATPITGEPTLPRDAP